MEQNELRHQRCKLFGISYKERNTRCAKYTERLTQPYAMLTIEQ